MKNKTNVFARDASGNVALLFGLSLLPIVAAGGIAIDYSNASNARSVLQAAADAASLAGAKVRSKSDSAAEKEAKMVFAANLEAARMPSLSTPKINFFGTGGIRVSGTATLDSKFKTLSGKGSYELAYGAESDVVQSTAPSVDAGDEIALVLDNTGSMINDMAALRDSASHFVDKVMNGTTKVSVVPFVTAVNVGSKNLKTNHLDKDSKSQWHGIFTQFVDEPKTRGSAIVPFNIGVSIGGCNYFSVSAPGTGPGKGGSGAFLFPNKIIAPGQWDIADSLMDIFGINPAHANSAKKTPNTIAPLSGKYIDSGQYSIQRKQVFLPDGFNAVHDGCQLDAPLRVNHFDLLDRLPGATWKGCVEARPEPYDVTDDEPTPSKPDTLFTPYFWPDDHDDPNHSYFGAPINNYLSDGKLPDGWEPRNVIPNILKYNNVSKANIVETAPNTQGPNKACPSEMLRLTTNKTVVKQTVQNMQYWNGGGTILVEGLAWGWRSLSPNAPFSDGKAYSKEAKKTIVFMSDGENEMAEASKPEQYSHYTGYGYLGTGRFPLAKFKEAHTYLDERFLLACTNAKAKGIRIITVLFRHNTGNAVSLMEKCASAKSDAYFAGSQVDLKATFDKIGSQYSSTTLRLTK